MQYRSDLASPSSPVPPALTPARWPIPRSGARLATVAEQAFETTGAGVLWGVGAVSRRLDIATPTLRSWERRYGLGPSVRTSGGHRRYSETDIARLARMRELIAQDVPPAQAAGLARQQPAAGVESVPALHPAAAHADSSLGDPTSDAASIAAMVRAARVLDSRAMSRTLVHVFERRGVCAGWEHVVVPMLVAVGEAWANGEAGIEVEHMASECVDTELRLRLRRSGVHSAESPSVLLASAEGDLHALPVVALAAALGERRVTSRVLGPRLPLSALTTAVRRTHPRVVFLWSSLRATGRVPSLDDLDHDDRPPALVLGGPGWTGKGLGPVPPDRHVERVGDLGSAVDTIGRLVA